MLCQICSKLSLNSKKSICVRCKGNIEINLAVICNQCSNSEKLCAICLKKMMPNTIKRKSGCGCGGK